MVHSVLKGERKNKHRLLTQYNGDSVLGGQLERDKKTVIENLNNRLPLRPLFACFLLDLLLSLLSILVFLNQIFVEFFSLLEVRLPNIFLKVLNIYQLWKKLLMFS